MKVSVAGNGLDVVGGLKVKFIVSVGTESAKTRAADRTQMLTNNNVSLMNLLTKPNLLRTIEIVLDGSVSKSAERTYAKRMRKSIAEILYVSTQKNAELCDGDFVSE
jgi:hypothetical protein